MTPHDDAIEQLQNAVRTIWIECGETPPAGAELQRAAIDLRAALSLGRQVPRQSDKTLQPMAGRRDDIERATNDLQAHDASRRARR